MNNKNMKAINEYINESIRLDEAKKVKIADLLKGLDKIEKWNKADNIKKLMSEYMSAGDAEDLDPKHWDACELAVKDTINGIIIFVDGYTDGDNIDFGELTDWLCDTMENGDDHILSDLNKIDKEGDWDEDDIINLFNTVSTKVCKEAWLI